MLPQLLIHRVGAFVALSARAKSALVPFPNTISDEELNTATKYLEYESAAFKEAKESVYAVLENFTKFCEFVMPEEFEKEPILLNTVGLADNAEKGLAEPVVARFPPIIFNIKLEGLTARIRTHFSLTTCVFERPDGRTKIWITTELVPLRGAGSWSNGVAELVKMQDQICDCALPHIAQAISDLVQNSVIFPKIDIEFDKSQLLLLENEKIRITLADDFDPDVGAFINAVDIEGRDPRSLESIDLKQASLVDKTLHQGYSKFWEFVEDTDPGARLKATNELKIKLPVPASSTIEKRNNLSQIASIYNERSVASDSMPLRSIRIVGFARRHGVGNVRNVPTEDPFLAEQMLQAASGARIASGYLADEISRNIELQKKSVSAPEI